MSSDIPKIQGLDSGDVQTNDILKIIGHDYVRILKETQDIKHGIEGMRNFMFHETDEFKVKPTKDESDSITVQGVPETILWQYQPVNQEEYNKHQILISQAMASIPEVIHYLEESFWKLEHLKDPSPVVVMPNMIQPPTMNPPAKIGQPSIQQRIQSMFTGKPIRTESPYNRIQELIDYYQEIPNVWGLLKEYHATAIANKGASWSSIMNRSGMENFLQIMQSQFSYWIEPKLIEAVTLSNKVRLDKNKAFADSFVKALAYTQKQHEQV